ncbi:MAG: hypothetical protein ACT4O3_06090 [Elusimicrobiota bacterium]
MALTPLPAPLWRSLRGGVCIFYLFMAAWGLGLAALAREHFSRRDADAFRLACRRAVDHWAEDVADALARGDARALQERLDRLAAQPESRYALWQPAAGTPRTSAGSPPEPALDESLSREAVKAEAAQAREIQGPPPFVEWSRPVSVDGRAAGVLRWGVWTDKLEESRRAHGRRLLAAWAWAAAVGAVGCYIFLSRFPHET